MGGERFRKLKFKSQNFVRYIGLLFAALIALDQERPANRHRFEGVRFAQ